MPERLPKPIDDTKLAIFFGLDLNEILVFGALVIIGPLLMFATSLPWAVKLLGVGCLLLSAFLLYFVPYEGQTMAYWIGRVLPFWLRQRRFVTEPNTRGRITPVMDLIDEVAYAPQENRLSFRWEDGANGVRVLHIYEHPGTAITLKKVHHRPRPLIRTILDRFA